MPGTLSLILILLLAAVVAVVICRRLHLPPILGYLATGVTLGPFGFNWVPDTPQTRYLAEFGVVFLMFSIGLEFSLPKLKAMRRVVFGLGLAQVMVTIIGAVALTMLVGKGWEIGLALGGALAMSSTAIVSKLLVERMELNTPHGRDAMGILLCQDLAVVPLLILVPTLAKSPDEMWSNLGWAAIKAAAALFLILWLGQRLLGKWFTLVASQRSGELFMLNLLLVTLGLAFMTEHAGLSMALGAFLAGMLIAETEFRYQVEEDIKPFRDVLLGLFFVTVGMQLDPGLVLRNFGWVLVLLIGPVIAKGLSIVLLAKAFGVGWPTAIRTGIYLAQAGEFGLVLLAVASEAKFVGGETMQLILAAMLLSMLVGPFLIQYSEPIVRRLTANDWLMRAAELHKIAVQTMARQEHVIICGFGRSGQNLARFLEQEEVNFIALDSDPQRVREAAAVGGSVVYGDAGRREALVAAGLNRARALAITFADTGLALKILHHVRAVRPDLPVIVRTVDDTELDKLLDAGAAEVVPEVLEGSLMLATHSLMLLGVPLNRVLKRIRAVREERYGLFRGFFHGATDAGDDGRQPRLLSVHLVDGAAAIGKSMSDMAIEELVEVTSIRRSRTHTIGRFGKPQPDWIFESGDTLVLLGTPENLAVAERRLLEG